MIRPLSSHMYIFIVDEMFILVKQSSLSTISSGSSFSLSLHPPTSLFSLTVTQTHIASVQLENHIGLKREECTVRTIEM